MKISARQNAITSAVITDTMPTQPPRVVILRDFIACYECEGCT